MIEGKKGYYFCGSNVSQNFFCDRRTKIRHMLKWIFIFSLVLQIVLFFSIFFWDYYAGQLTAGFGVEGKHYLGIGNFYIYVISFLLSLIVVSAIYKGNQFGIGFSIFIPYAIIGFFVEYYYEVIKNPVLRGEWAVIGWCLVGLLVGLSADSSFKILTEKTKLKEEYSAGLTGVILNLTYFFLTWFAHEVFYINNTVLTGSGSFLGIAYFTVPWMIIHGFFGGLLAFYLNNQ
ncbi:MAG: hypothetical protein ACFE95_01460 [Candidatus Hodarchaeota archaeon]